MPEYEYIVAMDGPIVARGMDLATALILAEALMKKYYAEPRLEVLITREEKSVCEGR